MAYQIMIVVLEARSHQAPKVQECLTRYGCNIKTRLGLTKPLGILCEDGLVILELTGKRRKRIAEKELKSLRELLFNIWRFSIDFCYSRNQRFRFTGVYSNPFTATVLFSSLMF